MAAAREDGRLANELRPVRCERGVLNRADGSARWANGELRSKLPVQSYVEACAYPKCFGLAVGVATSPSGHTSCCEGSGPVEIATYCRDFDLLQTPRAACSLFREVAFR